MASNQPHQDPSPSTTPSATAHVRAKRKKKRAPKACRRCRDQKIRCNGSEPCHQCGKRDLACHFDEQPQKAITTRGYIDGLKEKIALLEGKTSLSSPLPGVELESRVAPDDGKTASEARSSRSGQLTDNSPVKPSSGSPHIRDPASSEPRLSNPLAFHTTDWVLGPEGKPYFMGTSPN